MRRIAARLEESLKEDPSEPSATMDAMTDDPKIVDSLVSTLKKNGWRMCVQKQRWWIHTNDCICIGDRCMLDLFD
jgi:hypothetical protein